MKRQRLIINTDAKNEADDQYAIVHALLSPSVDIAGIIAAHFGTHRTNQSMQESREEIDLLLQLMELTGTVEVANGAPKAISNETAPIDSPGAQLIIREAKKPGPLKVIFLGPLTDMASAFLLEPTIAQNPDLTVIWIGGDPYDPLYTNLLWPDGAEFNLNNDVHAANVVFGSGIRIWQVPRTVYSMVGVGYAELDEKVATCGKIGEYLVRQLKEFNAGAGLDIEYRSLGDSPAVGAVLNPLSLNCRVHPVRRFSLDARMTGVVVPGRTVFVAESCDVRWLMEDLFAKLRAFAAKYMKKETT